MTEALISAGSVDRHNGGLLTIDTGTGLGKTHAAKHVGVLLERAARATAANADGQPPFEALQEVLTAFEEGALSLPRLPGIPVACWMYCSWFAS